MKNSLKRYAIILVCSLFVLSAIALPIWAEDCDEEPQCSKCQIEVNCECVYWGTPCGDECCVDDPCKSCGCCSGTCCGDVCNCPNSCCNNACCPAPGSCCGDGCPCPSGQECCNGKCCGGNCWGCKNGPGCEVLSAPCNLYDGCTPGAGNCGSTGWDMIQVPKCHWVCGEGITSCNDCSNNISYECARGMDCTCIMTVQSAPFYECVFNVPVSSYGKGCHVTGGCS